MDLFVIRGGRPLGGRVAVGGSKNATLPIMAASLMIDGKVTLTGVPDLADVTTLSRVLASLGVAVSHYRSPLILTREAGNEENGLASSAETRQTTRFTDAETGYPDQQGNPPLLTARPRGEEGRQAAVQDGLAEDFKTGVLALEPRDESNSIADYDLVRRMRASVCVLGPLLAKRRRAVVSLPGGCNIGDRPIDVHLRGLAALGASIQVEQGYVVATADKLRGTEIDLTGPRGPTVTGTANVLTAAVLASGRTILKNAAREPEIVDLIRFLSSAGAKIDGAGTSVIEVEGVETLNPVEHRVIPDRIEAATLMMATAIAGGDVVLDHVPASDLSLVIERLSRAGVCIDANGPQSLACATVRMTGSETLRPIDVVAESYPGFPTDLQAQWMALMTQARGASQITDTVFPDRFLHIPELARLGADITRTSQGATVQGGQILRGTNVMASDLRASAALVLAALVAHGETVIRRIYHLDRGYERLDAKLAALGADVVRRTDDAAIAVPPPDAA